MKLTAISLAAVGLLAAPQALAVITLSKLFINPPGTDQGLEFIELSSTTGGVEAMTGLTLLVIEGDAGAAGTIDQALSLDAFSTGSNGIFLWRDSATVLDPAPAGGSAVHVADFTPDLENGSNTFLIVSGFTGTVATDYDTNNDGVLDSTPWTAVVDGLGFRENDDPPANNISYAGSLGFPTMDPVTGDNAFNADALVRLPGGAWAGFDVTALGANGPFEADPDRNFVQGAPSTGTLPPGFTLQPGVPVPEPGTAALASLLALGLMRRRR